MNRIQRIIQRITNVLVNVAVILAVIVGYNWLTTTPLGASLPRWNAIQPAPAAIPTAAVAGAQDVLPAPLTAVPAATMTVMPTETATPTITPSPTITRTPSPTVYVVQYSAIVRQVKSIAELNTKSVLIDVVVTYNDEGQNNVMSIWDKGDFLSVKSTYRVKVGIDWQAVNVNIGNNNQVTVTFNPARISSLDEIEEESEVNYYKKGIRAIFAEDDMVNSTRLKQARIDSEQKARERICEMGVVADAAADARSYVKSFILQLNPQLNANDVTVVIESDDQCR